MCTTRVEECVVMSGREGVVRTLRGGHLRGGLVGW